MISPLADGHRQHGVPLLVFQEAQWPVQFREPIEEYRAVQERVGLFDASALGLLELTGRDRATFLHGLVTNDLKHLPLHHACWACTLTPTGKVTAVCLVAHRDDAHWLIIPRWLRSRVRTFFEQYLIMEDVQIADRSEEWTLLALQGPQAAQLAPTIHAMTLATIPHDPLGVPGVLCVVRNDAAVAVWERCQQQGAQPVGLTAFQMLRLEAGLPWYGVDVDETCLLPETGWERTATSYTKGCYIGQEIVARVASQGRVARHLVGLKLSSPQPPTTPCEILCDGQPCGTLTSAASSPRYEAALGLGMLSRKAWETHAPLVVSGQQPLAAELVPLPQLPLPS